MDENLQPADAIQERFGRRAVEFRRRDDPAGRRASTTSRSLTALRDRVRSSTCWST